MPTFIKAGFWEKLCQKCTGYKGWLNLDQFVEERAGGLPYKVYTALLTQSGTNPPVAIVLENTLGGTPVWTRDSAGNYNATLSGVFTENKTFVTYTHDGNNGSTGFPGGARWDDDTVWLTFNDKDGVYIDIGSSAIDSVEIRVYP